MDPYHYLPVLLCKPSVATLGHQPLALLEKRQGSEEFLRILTLKTMGEKRLSWAFEMALQRRCVAVHAVQQLRNRMESTW